MNQRLYRSPDDRILAGVAGGMAETYDLDPALVRVGWALLILVSGGIFLVLYIIMALAVPLRPPTMPLPWVSPPTGTASPGPVHGADSDSAPAPPPAAGPAPPHYEPWRYQRYQRHHRNEASGALLVGIILIGAGAFFLLREYVPSIDTNLLWPLLAIGLGLLFIVAALGRPGARQ
jgi:phage shock protein C